MDLIQKNREMLLAGKYNVQDTRQLSRIASLSEPNDYDLYLIACALCNYDISEKAEARDLRMQLFLKTSNSGLDYSHKQSDYNKIETKLKCTNTGKTNKFGLYEYEINVNDRDLVSDLWEYKAKDCLKYVDNKTFPDKIIVSIGKNQLSNFKDMLDKLGIAHEKKNMDDGVVFTNKSTHKLIDLSELDLPFTPYDFQLEDAEKILKKKRALLGHDMGCFVGSTTVNLANGKIMKIKDLVNEEPFLVSSYNIETKQFVDKLATASKTRTNAELIIVRYTNIISNENFEIYCTPDHKFLVNINYNYEWLEARNLKPNMKLVSENNEIYLDNIELTDMQEDVYCLSVNDTHNFTINGGTVVHNCGKTFISVLVGCSIFNKEDVIYRTLDNLEYNDTVITDKGPLPIGKIVEENIDCKVQVIKNGENKFVNIIDRNCVEL